MALDKLVDSSQLNGALGSTADAIRAKTGESGLLTWDMDTGFSVPIGDIVTLDEGTADADATSNDILNGKTAYVDGEKVVGNIPTKTSENITASGATVTVPSGYYASDATKTIDSGSVTQNAPTVNTSTGVVTATSTVTAGYVTAGTKSNTLSLSTQVAKTVAPTESEKIAVAAGKYTTGEVRVGAVSSTYVGSEVPRNDSDDLTASGATVTVPAGYYEEDASKSIANGSVVQNAPTVNASGLVTATSTVTAGYVGADTKGNTLQLATQGATTYNTSSSDQEIASGKYLTGKQTIKAVTTSGISASNIKDGVSVKVGDANNSTRIKNVTGTFTDASTVSSGQTAAGAGQIRTGYSAWVDGAEVKGSLGNTSVTQGTTTVSGTTATRGNATWGNGVISSGSMGAATFANTATEGKTYVDISSTTDAPVLISGDNLYINKGYTDDLKISLAKLVPDGASADLGSGVILSGYSAYNNEGALVAGNIPTKSALDVNVNGKTVTVPTGYYGSDVSKSVAVGSVTSGTASITSINKTYNASTGKFDVSGSADVSAPTVGTAGYISSSEGTKSKKTGGATVSTTLNKIAGSVSITGTTTKQPVITKQSTPSGVTNAADGDATTTAPSSGVYVAVKSAANTGTLTATPSVTSEGYGDSTNHAITGNTATVGALASNTTYVPIKTTSASVSGKTVSYGSGWITEGSKSVAVGTVTSGSANITSLSNAYNSTNDNFDVTGSADVSAPSVGTAGYVSSSEGTKNKNTGGATVTATMPKIVGSTAITGTKTAKPSITKQDVPSGVTQAASGNATTTVPSSGVYVAVKSAANTGTLTATPSVTTDGYGTSAKHGIAKATATVGASASDTTYVPIATTSATVNGKTVSYGSGWITEGSKSVADGSVTQNAPTIDSATGLVTATTTVAEGYVASDTKSNTLQLTAKGATTYPTSTSNQTIAAGTYLTGTQTIRAVTTSGIEAGNIKDGAVIKVGDSASSGRIKNITGTFTDASTVSEGQTAATSGTILNGYSAWVDGEEVQGNIATKTNLTVNGKTVTAPAGFYPNDTSASVSVGTVTSGTATITSITKAYNSTTGKFDIAGSADVSAPTVGTAGYISSSEGTRSKKTGGATVSATIDKIVGSTAITGTTTKKPTITKQNVPSGVTQAASGDATTTAPSSGVYVAVKSAANTGTLTATPSVSTEGYGTTNYHGIAGNTATVGASASDTTYVPITTTTASVSGKTVSYGSGWITSGSKSVAVGAVTSGSATIDSASYSYNSTNDNFTVTGSKEIGAPTVDTAGYISSSEGTKNGNTATLETTVAKIVGSTAFSGTTTKQPSITKQDVPSGVTQAASGAATTTAPSSGVYVAVKSAANTGSITATPSVTTAGYGTASNHGIAGNSTTVGASASATTYVPITTATPTFSSPTPSGGSTATGTNVTLSTTNNGIAVQTKYSVNQATVTYNAAVNGWVSKASGAEAVKTTARSSTNGTAYYVTAVAVPKDTGFTVSTTADTALDTTSDLDVTNNAYRRVDIVNNANGTVLVNNTGNVEVTSAATDAGKVTIKAKTTSGDSATTDKEIVTNGLWATTAANAGGTYYGRVTVASGSATTPATTISSAPSISIDANGLITATNSKTQSVTPTVSAGYVASGTAGTITVGGSNTKQMTTKAATTYNVSTSNQTIASGTYLTGTQTFRAVTTSGIDAANIKDGAIVKVGDAGSATRIKNVTGTFTDAATVSSGQTAAAAGQIRSGYSAWVDGAEVKGSLPNTTVTEGTTTVSDSTATRGEWSQTAGYTGARTIAPATFASSATSGIDYVDISSTEEAPVLVAGDSLYINKGYTDNLKISLAKLVPDGSDVKGHGDYLLSGHSAYDNDGTLVAGTIQSMAGGTKYATTSNQTISTSGKYLTSNIVINKLSSTNYSAANIKNGTTISVSNGSSNVFSVAGTFTKANTVSSGQTAATASQMLSGYSAWVDGAEVMGNIATKTSSDLTKSGATVTAPAGYYAEAASATISNGTITSGSATISSASYAYNSTNGNFDVTGSATVGAPTVGTAGYVSSSAGTKNTNTATLSTTVAKVVGATTITGTTTKVPSIAKQAISISGVTDAASGAATTTAPSSGVYVAVKSAANTGTLTATPSITTAGYGTADNHGITAQTATVGASASSVTYVPITTATPTFSSPTPSGGSTAEGTNVTLSTTDNGIKVQTKYSVNQATVTYNAAVNGWVSKASGAEAVKTTARSATNGTAYYVTAVTVPKDKGFTVTTTADTALDTTSDLDVTNNAYRRVDITNAANGTILVANSGNTSVTSGSTTAGNLTVSAYNASGTAENDKSIVSAGKWVSTSVSASGTYYGRVTVGGGAVTPVTANSGLSTYFNSGTSSDYNVSITPQYTNTAGYIAAHSTATSGTAAYYKIKTASPAFTGGGLSGTATASSSTASLSDSTNNSGISLATACTATRANVTYNGAVSGWVSKSSGTVALSSGTGAMTAKTYYINGVTMSKPSSGTRTFTVTAPGGTDNHVYTFTTDANGRTTIKVDSTLTMEWNATDESLDFIYT